MGILRTDRITGLGGANAITGSTSFGGSGNHLKVEGIDDDFVTWWTADFTIEAWVFIDNFASWMYDDGNHFPAMVGHMNPTDTSNYWSFGPAESPAGNSTLKFYYWKGSQNHTFVHTATIKENEWTHIAMSFSTSNGAKLFINGTGTSYISLSGTPQVSSSAVQFVVGQYGNQNISGNISNLRILKGTALYTSDFTPPTNRLEKTSDTKLLICNSASDVTHNDDEKIITSVRSSTNNSGPVASRFTPNSPVGFSTTTDVGSQYGTTFNGFGNFATSTYMVPPGGNTRERNRGRAIMAGGMRYPTANANIIEMLEIQSGGQTQDFGDLITATSSSGPVSSSTRAVVVAGLGPSARTNAIEFVTIASTGNATDFGDYVEDLGYVGGVSNETRGVTAGGSGPSSPSSTNQIGYITIATAGNAQNFGDLSGNTQGAMGVQSSTRGVFNLGYVGGFVNTIEYITIASTGDTTDFGDLSRTNSAFGGSCCSSTRGLFAGGYNNTPASVTEVNNIDYITIASTGDATDFGDLVTAGFYCFGTSNKTRGIFQGRLTTAPTSGDPMIDSVTIATTGNAVVWGEMHRMDSGPADGQAIKRRGATTMSDSHGGLS